MDPRGEALLSELLDAVLPARLATCLIGIRIVNVDPLPSSPTRVIEPCMSVASCLQILKPRPVPLYFLVSCMSPWKNGSKMRSCKYDGMPTPVSLTSNSKINSLAFGGG